MHRKQILSVLIFMAMCCHDALGSHLRAGEIQATRIDCSSLNFRITILVYVNYHSNVRLGGQDDWLSFGDGTSMLVPEINDIEIIDRELGIGLQKFTTTHTYSSFGKFTISYNEPNRNTGILNFSGSANTRFNIETFIYLEPNICNSPPVLLVPPVDKACAGVTFFHNPGAYDPDLDSLSFQLVVPKQSEGSFVSDYLFPNHESFYSSAGIPYGNANEAKTGPPQFIINPIDGNLTWDAPGIVGEYVFAIKVIEWKYKESDGTWYEVGHVIRDMQIIVENCDNQKPELKALDGEMNDFCVIAGTFIDFTYLATDPDGDSVFVEVFSDVFQLTENKPTITPPGGTLQSTQTSPGASINFTWQTTCLRVRQQSYQVIFKISDQPASGPRLVRFYSINIKIIAPEPEYGDVLINPIEKTVRLEWKDYPCDNVTSFQVWRRISAYDYDQPECESGMPNFLHYELLAATPGSTYTDSNLSFGAQYCYRIVALVGGRKVPGRLSLDTCFIPKPAEAPVIVNVSVKNTDTQNGEILIRWTRPFDIDRQQYPPPYQYKVFRKIESDPQSLFQRITPQTISDTVFTDFELNTKENIYRYQIELYVPALTTAPLDSSSEASSVFSSAHPAPDAIDVQWEAATPWYNYSQLYPYHLIYRSNSESGPFVLIDSVDVNENNFHYRDAGQYKGLRLSKELYYYKVLTRGTYGNPKIISPLENFSQITSGQILDTIPPCQPVLTIAKADCSEFACDGSDYYTRLEWQTSDAACEDDVIGYELFVKGEDSNAYTSLGMVTEKTFIHSNLNSLNKCYRVISLDRSGNRSDSSAVVCNSNCAVFKLPNVITPGVKDQRNDFLTTYPDDDNYKQDCSRSVRQVDIRIFSRWGEEIFTTTLNDVDSPVFWNGLNKKGVEVSAGTYYYHAEVIFDTHDPANQNVQIKGWVQVVR